MFGNVYSFCMIFDYKLDHQSKYGRVVKITNESIFTLRWGAGVKISILKYYEEEKFKYVIKVLSNKISLIAITAEQIIPF